MSAATATSATGSTGYIVTLTGGGDYTLGLFDYLTEVDLSGGATNVTLPDATKVPLMRYTVVRTVNAVNVLTVLGGGGQTINGAASAVVGLALFAAVTCESDGVNWVVITTPQDMPPGTILPYGGASAPTGYLLCDGSSVLRATYPALFGVLGTTFGSVDGTHFTLPNMVGRFPFGVAASGTGNALGATFGSIDHLHTVNPPNTTTGADSNDLTQPPSVVGTPNTAAAAHTHDVDIAQFNSGTANPPGLSLNFIIKV